MKDRLSKGPLIASAALGLALFALTCARMGGARATDLLFCLSNGFLIVGLLRLLSNLKAFASFLWGVRMLKRIFRNDFGTGRQETEDYARYREGMGGHRDVPVLLGAAAILFALSLVIA
ncbi:MAG: DUF3899 domain-containing protein [Clostridiales bacterium]|nr:DUF3899 domain-containing protein [Clostridiales bacterium]